MTTNNPPAITPGTPQNPAPGLGYCISPDGTQAAFRQGDTCPVGWSYGVISDARKLQQMIANAGGVVDIGPGQGANPFTGGGNSGSDIRGPTAGVSLSPVTLDPGSFFTNPTGGAAGDIGGTLDLAAIGGYLHKALQHLTDPAFWKGTGLLLGGVVVAILGFVLWKGHDAEQVAKVA